MANPRRRTQIAAAATELFDTRGYFGTGMTDIAAACGMSASSLYNHYSSKHELLAEIVSSSMQQLLTQHAAGLAGLDTPAERLHASMVAHVVFHAEFAQAARVVNQEINTLEEPARSVVRQLRRDYVARWVDIVKTGVTDGVFEVEDVQLACYAMIDMGIGVALWFRPDRGYDAPSLGEAYAKMALEIVRADAQQDAQPDAQQDTQR